MSATDTRNAIEDEWKAAQRGAWKKKAPVVAGLVTGFVLAAGVTAVAMSVAEADERQVEELRERGYEVRCKSLRSGSSRPGPCHQAENGGLTLLAIAVAAVGGFAGGYRIAGGRMSAEHMRGLKSL